MTLLLTSFAPWKAHQSTNSSDDLIALLAARRQLPPNTQLLRHLPVHFQLAPCEVLTAIHRWRPTAVVCCGMAEQRSLLNVERYAHGQSQRLATSIDLDSLCAATQWTEISHDAGTYVCNDLYYRLLAYVERYRLSIGGLFIHVPPLTPYNQEPIARDFEAILAHLAKPANRWAIKAA